MKDGFWVRAENHAPEDFDVEDFDVIEAKENKTVKDKIQI